MVSPADPVVMVLAGMGDSPVHGPADRRRPGEDRRRLCPAGPAPVAGHPDRGILHLRAGL